MTSICIRARRCSEPRMPRSGARGADEIGIEMLPDRIDPGSTV
jgi:hypothetical protein